MINPLIFGSHTKSGRISSEFYYIFRIGPPLYFVSITGVIDALEIF